MYRLIALTVLAIPLVLCGCTPTEMTLKPEQAAAINPVGVYIIASSQMLDNADSVHKDFTVRVAGAELSQILTAKGYAVQLLNNRIPVDSVFSKPLFAFYIDEKEIARRARSAGCTTSLVVYFAYAGESTTLASGLNAYSLCSLYGWLMGNEDAEIITSSHSRLSSYPAFLEQLPIEVRVLGGRETYRRFFIRILNDMFSPLPKL